MVSHMRKPLQSTALMQRVSKVWIFLIVFERVNLKISKILQIRKFQFRLYQPWHQLETVIDTSTGINTKLTQGNIKGKGRGKNYYTSIFQLYFSG